MKKKFYLPIVICSLLLGVASTFPIAAFGSETVGSIVSPATGDVASVVALTLVGIAAIGGLLLRKSR